MKKKIGIAGVLCCLGLVMCLGIAGVTVGAKQKKDKTEESTTQVEMSLENREEVSLVQTEETRISKEEQCIEQQATEKTSVSMNAATTEKAGVSMNAATTEEAGVSMNETSAEQEYSNFAIADVDNYVNVRSKPSTEGEIVGKIYDGAVAQVLDVAGEEDDWFQITSGNVEGYIKSEFFLYGEKAAAVMDEYVTRYAKVKADRLNVRAGQSTDEKRIGYIDQGEKVKLLEDCGEWLRVQYTEQKEGYVAAEYVLILEEYAYAKTLEEEQEELAAKKALEERKNVQEQEAPEVLANVEFPTTTYNSNGELRSAIVSHAMEYVGNRYVSGGGSLADGTDCSGFTCFVYADFGYSISRTPGGQYSSAGRSIDFSEIQPGDIICYSSNGGKSCTHVALYIGNGQIVHSANSRKGVIVGAADYNPIIGIRNVID